MTDLVFLAVAVIFFGLCLAYVRALDRMVGPGPESDGTGEASR